MLFHQMNIMTLRGVNIPVPRISDITLIELPQKDISNKHFLYHLQMTDHSHYQGKNIRFFFFRGSYFVKPFGKLAIVNALLHAYLFHIYMFYCMHILVFHSSYSIEIGSNSLFATMYNFFYTGHHIHSKSM